jgi:hypothetical protein
MLQQQWSVLCPLQLPNLMQLLRVLGCRVVLQSATARSWRQLKALRSIRQAFCST